MRNALFWVIYLIGAVFVSIYILKYRKKLAKNTFQRYKKWGISTGSEHQWEISFLIIGIISVFITILGFFGAVVSLWEVLKK
jgi:hypothetical protein